MGVSTHLTTLINSIHSRQTKKGNKGYVQDSVTPFKNVIKVDAFFLAMGDIYFTVYCGKVVTSAVFDWSKFGNRAEYCRQLNVIGVYILRKGQHKIKKAVKVDKGFKLKF